MSFVIGDDQDYRVLRTISCLRDVFSEFYMHRRGDNRMTFSMSFDDEYYVQVEVVDRVENRACDLRFNIFIIPIALPEHLSNLTLTYTEEFVMSYEASIRNKRIQEVAEELVSRILISWNQLIQRYERSIK